MPVAYYTAMVVYKICWWLIQLSMWIESHYWGYEWCKKCNGKAIYPMSGLWGQPDGYKLCPRCRGHRWEHVAEALNKRNQPKQEEGR